MDKLTIEEKAKRYDEAIEIARKIKNGEPINVPDGTLISDVIFPELKESEDERILRSLKAVVKEYDMWTERGLSMNDVLAWLEKQGDKDKIIQELGKYKVKYTQEVLEKHLKTINKDDEKLRKTTIAFLKDFAEQGYENAVECIDWLEKQGESVEINPTEFDTRLQGSCQTPDEIIEECHQDNADHIIDIVTEQEKPSEWSEEDGSNR